MDLLPLITAGASAVFLATCAALAWRSSPALRSAHRRRWVIIGGFVALVAPYLAFSASRWDPDVAAAIARADRSIRIAAHHFCGSLVATADLPPDRRMLGDGVIDLFADLATAGGAGAAG